MLIFTISFIIGRYLFYIHFINNTKHIKMYNFYITYSTSEPATPLSRPLQNTLKSRYFDLKYLNHYLIIFSKNLNISSYIPILVYIIILECAA